MVYTDREGQPGQHWLALWTCNDECEVLDNYALPLETYLTTQPLRAWLDRHWKIVIQNGQSLQSLYSRSWGDYALFFLIDCSQGKSMDKFLKRFDKHDYVHNDHKVGQMLKKLIEKEIGWNEVCKCDYQQDTCASHCGVRHLLL